MALRQRYSIIDAHRFLSSGYQQEIQYAFTFLSFPKCQPRQNILSDAPFLMPS